MSARRRTGKSALRFAGTEMLASPPRCARECGLILNALTQGRPSGNRANPGLDSQTPLGFSEGAKTLNPRLKRRAIVSRPCGTRALVDAQPTVKTPLKRRAILDC